MQDHHETLPKRSCRPKEGSLAESPQKTGTNLNVIFECLARATPVRFPV
jgi:hypothetical protein